MVQEFQMSSQNTLYGKLESDRKELLDLTTRNRLLNTPRSSTRSARLEIVDELSQEVFRILVLEKRPMSFLPEKQSKDINGQLISSEQTLLFQPEEELKETGLAPRHTDDRLQTQLTSEVLQKRLLKLFFDARTFEEEQGVNILYLALGFLKWYEVDHSDRERHAPLVLIPVTLERQSASSRFKISYSEDEITTNLSLQEKLKADFGITLPDVPDIEEFSIDGYFNDIKKAISSQSKWEILPNDIVLWFFSFSKFLMYRDLLPDTWPKDRQLDTHPLIVGLLQNGMPDVPPLFTEDQHIDDVVQPIDMLHVLDADSSQAFAIEEIKRGRNLVIQGPPGTGKSQTIVNLIATAVKENKKVLFVAEKLAALEVVKRRLDQIKLGDMCLELHSNKTNKKMILEDLGRTMNLGSPKMDDITRITEELKNYRDRLNRHVQILHAPFDSKHTPYQIIGELVRLRSMGLKPPNFKLVNALNWTLQQFHEKSNLINDLVIHLEQIGNPQAHPWRGVEMEVALPMDVDRLTAAIQEIIPRLDHLIQATGQLADNLKLSPGTTALDTASLAKFAQKLLIAPPMDRKCFGDPVWINRREQIDLLVQIGSTLSGVRGQLKGLVTEKAWSTDINIIRDNLSIYGRSWFRIFYKSYRNAKNSLHGLWVSKPLKLLSSQLEILDKLIYGQKALHAITEKNNQDLGEKAFGRLWQGIDSDWPALSAITGWEKEVCAKGAPDTFHTIVAGLDDTSTTSNLISEIAGFLKPTLENIRQLFIQLKLNVNAAFDSTDLRVISLTALKSRLEIWRTNAESITKWIAYYQRFRKLAVEGLSELAKLIDQESIKANEILNSFQMAYYETLLIEVFRRYPELAEFNGNSYEQILQRFKQLDVERISLARQEVAMAHYTNIPKSQAGGGEVGILRREIQKKRRHLPLRRLLKEAGRAIQAIKPVFMMSPISIAQYLQPGEIEFDLLLIDEASQVRPVEALGAIARAKQVVVVGDDRQLPPTRFFNRLLNDDDTEEEESEDFRTSDLESVLGLCTAQNIPQRMLNWHYRSRHHTLIAVSNHEFYNDKLFVVPNPEKQSSGLGLSMRYIPDGVFDRGGSATNQREAQEVANAVIEHARNYLDKTLGVGAFSVSQRDAILDELELCRRREPTLEAFFASSKPEPFFVKNLENIQGDERDVIFISVGYAKDHSGYMSMNFGPLGNEGGERRLNVLITRAKERCEVFSSITGDDIDLNRAKSRGAQAFKTFLTYAKSGLLDTQLKTGKDYDSEFELEVAKALSHHGYKIDPQVGVAGFFIDLAVVDPELPGRYLLGIECDGATYHSSRSARDRDRLRQQVLEDRGWIIHRIWSTDWFYRPEEQLQKTIAAIERAKIEWTSRNGTNYNNHPNNIFKPVQETIIRTNNDCDLTNNGLPVETEKYTEASFVVDNNISIHDVPTTKLGEVVTKVVSIEGPIHRDEIIKRIVALWGLKRTGNRIVKAVNLAISRAVSWKNIKQDGLFYSIPTQEKAPIRNRENVGSNTLRQPEMLPPPEIQAAIQAVVVAQLGIPAEDVTLQTARLFGFQSTSNQLKEIISRQIEYLLKNNALQLRNGNLYLTENNK
jgi:very-short-patch-repair endonuclease/DNA polymerase III delta prime subunit